MDIDEEKSWPVVANKLDVKGNSLGYDDGLYISVFVNNETLPEYVNV